MAKKKKVQHSRYWIGNHIYDALEKDEKFSTSTLLRLANIRRGIANFVRIMTGTDIPVKFSNGVRSYTDGKKFIVISCTDKVDDFDSTVGLALHESSHVVQSQKYFDMLQYLFSVQMDTRLHQLVDAAVKCGRVGGLIPTSHQYDAVKRDINFILNFLEDRRIDLWAWEKAPGYRPYYKALYDRYFFSPFISWKLLQPESQIPTIQNYILHILNMFTKYADPDVLPHLRDIWQIVDIENIERYNADYNHMVELKDYRNHRMMKDAIAIVKIIYENSVPAVGNENGMSSKDLPDVKKNENYDELAPEKLDNYDLPDDFFQETKESQSGEGESNDPQASGEGKESAGEEKKEELSSYQKDNLNKLADKALNRQKKFLDGDVGKEQVSASIDVIMSELDASKAELREAGGEIDRDAKCRVVIYHKVNLSTLSNGAIRLARRNLSGNIRICSASREAVRDGQRLGSVLVHRVRILNDESTMTFSRQKSGRLDKRLVSSLGYDNENAFARTQVVRLAPVMVDLSVDASSSMEGAKWQKALTLAVALAYMSSKLRNMRLRINLRSSHGYDAQIGIVYDSKVDNFSKVITVFPYLSPEGSTPEGLCYEAMRQELLEDVKNTRRFFINLSDGQPSFHWSTADKSISYTGPLAARHTMHQINDMRKAGIKILSYYISDYENDFIKEQFKTMYGKDAAFIDTDSVPDIARTLSNLFLQEG